MFSSPARESRVFRQHPRTVPAPGEAKPQTLRGSWQKKAAACVGYKAAANPRTRGLVRRRERRLAATPNGGFDRGDQLPLNVNLGRMMTFI